MLSDSSELDIRIVPFKNMNISMIKPISDASYDSLQLKRKRKKSQGIN